LIVIVSKLTGVESGEGVPLSMRVDAANRYDMKMNRATLQSIVLDRPEPTIRSKQHRYG
jgi:hypothetical protein